MTTYLYGDRKTTELVAAWKEAEAEGVAIDQAIAPLPLRKRARLRLHGELSPGDLLVVDDLGTLGETYQEIVDAVRELMRRKVLLRSMVDNLVFDGAADRPAEQASRDALVGYVAAAAMDRKSARRAAQTRCAILAEKPPEAWEGEAGRLQFRVIAGQIAAFAVAVYLLGGLVPASHRREPPAPLSSAIQSRADVATDLPARPQLRPANADAETRSASDQPAEIAKPTSAPEPLNLSLAQARRTYATVARWRSARLQDPAFKAEIGATAPPEARLATFPRRLVARQRNLRGYKFVVADKRVAVIDPATRQVVAVVNP
ncbi:DUF1236 domain-containing protein [Methylocystis parvus]|uniref:DUF1236 domain-containing protein n=1 Tax=Methylocystis parvus TaxID=134 RepID=A0A6B8LV78_9HYPH|nr:DUF1236 domain-containing protein [Methylocystis parvus]QGM96277.1 DUF1236 domain-containing protein [Methylocystis parvus]WBJ99887.1 DUF1236 domain-containing protein [Methylocystis parvus OBBP]